MGLLLPLVTSIALDAPAVREQGCVVRASS
jgi:hypothetical protein